MNNNKAQLLLGLLFGIVFGFLLQKGGVTNYNIIIGQLLLTDFTVVKVMLSAVVTGMIGLHLIQKTGLIKLCTYPGSFGKNAIGGLIFGFGFALLGYCPGTLAGATGNGFLDAATAGLIGIIIGSGLFAKVYPKIKYGILNKGNFGNLSVPQFVKLSYPATIFFLSAAIIIVLILMERFGL